MSAPPCRQILVAPLPMINGKDHLIKFILYIHRTIAERFKSAKKRDEEPIGAGDEQTKKRDMRT